MITYDEMSEMAIAITLGATRPPDDYDEDRRFLWDKLVEEIHAIEKQGGMVDIPSI